MKLRFLDGLRGWAALAVVIGHFIGAFLPVAVDLRGQAHHMGEHLLYATPLHLVMDGTFSVCIFFVLSGIVLSASFFRRGDERVVAASAIRRYFRLAIPAGCSVLLAYLLIGSGHLYNHQAGQLSGSPWWQALFSFSATLHAAVTQGFVGIFSNDFDTYNPVLWTMKVELIGSFIVFGMLAIFGKLNRRWIIYGVLSLVFWKSYYLGFVMGMVIADVYFNNRLTALRAMMARGVWIPVFIAGLLIGSAPVGPLAGTIFAWIPQLWPGINQVQLLIVLDTVGAVLVLGAVMTSTWLQGLLQTRASLFMGRISFSLYLTHFIILASYTSYLLMVLRHNHGYRTSVLIAFLIGLVVSLTVAYVYAVCVDEPAIRLARFIQSRAFMPSGDMRPADLAESVPVVAQKPALVGAARSASEPLS